MVGFDIEVGGLFGYVIDLVVCLVCVGFVFFDDFDFD